MPRTVDFNGTQHEFPDNATDDQVREALMGHHQETAAPAQKGFFRSLYDSAVQPAVDTVKAIADRGGTAVLNDAIQSTFDKLHQYAGTANPNVHDYLQAVPFIGSTADTALTQAQQGNYAGAAGTTAGLAAQVLGPKLIKSAPGIASAAAPAIERMAPAISEAGAIANDAVRGGIAGGTEMTNHFGVKLPAAAIGATTGGLSARAIGLPTWVGAIPGAAAPVVKGATVAIKRGMGARATAQAIEASRAAGATPIWEGIPEAAPASNPPVTPIPGALPSGRVPGRLPVSAIQPDIPANAAAAPVSPVPAAYSGSEGGLQIPQVVNARSAVAKNIAAHLHAAGIGSEEINAIEANPDTWKLFWNNTGRIPGVSKQAQYAPSPATVDAVRDMLSGIEKTKGVVPKTNAAPVSSGPLVGNARALALAQQLASELGQTQ